MAPLKSLAMLAALTALAPNARADDVTRWEPLIAEASVRSGLPDAWTERIIHVESRAGAMSLMQLMPQALATWLDPSICA